MLSPHEQESDQGPIVAVLPSMENTDPISLRDTAKGVALRAGFLGAAGLIVFAAVFSLAAKAASGLVKLLVGTLLVAAGAGWLGWKVRKFQRRET